MRNSGLVFIVLVLIGCSKQKVIKEVAKNGLNVQLMQLQESGQLDYRVRIFPDKELINGDTGMQSKMWYDIDSCFYLLINQKKIFPSRQEPISNGVANSYEYMLLFENLEAIDKEAAFIYDDKHFNNQLYKFELN